MDSHRLSHQNPNYLHGCHPNDPKNPSDDPSFGQNPVLNLSLQFIACKPSVSRAPDRHWALKRLLNRYVTGNLPGKKYLEAYLHHQYRRNCRINTMRSTAASLNSFLLFCQKTGMRDIEQLSREQIEAFVEFEQDRGLKPNTVRTRLCCVYAFIRFLIKEKVLGYELLESKIKLKLPDLLPKAIDHDDITRLLAVIDNPRDRALILLLLRTGMRIGELLKTTMADIDLKEQKILIYQAEKTAVGRVVYYSADAQEALLGWLRCRDPYKHYLFYARGRDRLSYESSRSAFYKYLKAAGLEHSGYTLHCLRHTFATDLLNAGMRLECLQVLLGHTNLEVTRRYARLSDKTREKEYFTAMDRIEMGEHHADDQCDH